MTLGGIAESQVEEAMPAFRGPRPPSRPGPSRAGATRMLGARYEGVAPRGHGRLGAPHLAVALDELARDLELGEYGTHFLALNGVVRRRRELTSASRTAGDGVGECVRPARAQSAHSLLGTLQ